MHIDLFNPSFWGGNFWQGLGVLATFLGIILGPLSSILVDRLFGKKEHEDQINAYKALLQPEGSLGFGEWLFFLPLQAAAAYGLSILVQRVYQVNQRPMTCFVICLICVFIITWGLSMSRWKTLAKLLTWQFCIAFAVFCVLFVGNQKGATLLTHDFTFVKHLVGQYIPPDIKHFPMVASLRSVSLKTIPVDMSVATPAVARTVFIWVYAALLLFFLFCYTLYKRHHSNRISAFVHLSEKRRKEQLDLLEYRDKLASLELKALEKQGKEADLDLRKEQRSMVLDRERLAVEKERLEVESTRLDLEKKRAQYTLELTTLLIDTLYSGGGNPDVRAELLRNTLPAFKDFGHQNKESITLILDHLQEFQQQPPAIPATIV